MSSSLEPSVRSAREAPPVMDQDKMRIVTITAVKRNEEADFNNVIAQQIFSDWVLSLGLKPNNHKGGLSMGMTGKM